MLSNLLWWPWAQVGVAVPPVTPGSRPIGGRLPGELAKLPTRRRRRLHDIITDEEEIMTIILSLIDK